MRVITGRYKGHRLFAPSGKIIRPTTDRTREFLFSYLGDMIKDAYLLDLFAGTGNISYEFASRNCKEITAVEQNFKCSGFIKETVQKLNFENINVVKNNVFNFLKFTNKTYDIIFADPPYDLEGIDKIPELIFSRQLLNKEGWLIIEHSKKTELEHLPHFSQQRKYGKVNFSVFCFL